MTDSKLAGGRTLFSTMLKLILLVIIVGFITRIILLCNISAAEGSGFGLMDYVASFSLGIVNDACFGIIGMIFLWIFCATLVPQKFNKVPAAIILTLLVGALAILCFFNTPLHEFNRGLTKAIKYILGYWIAVFVVRLVFPKMRIPWTKLWFTIIVGIYIALIYFNAFSEYFFWAEFNVRYNFIAVDYLVYTNEVIGNIMESYSIVPMALCIVVMTIVTEWLFFRREIASVATLYSNTWKLKFSICYLLLLSLGVVVLNFNNKFQQTNNAYYNEIQANGVFRFYEAFLKNELEFSKFYATLPEAEAEAIVHGIYNSEGENIRMIQPVLPDSAELHPNIVLITIESLSADFMERYGNQLHLTPTLDSIANKSVVFEKVFATGNRTVRGLEAVTLSLPPCPGQSIVKKENNKGKQSIADILKAKGYDAFYFYGGLSYFDNMKSFFTNNGYNIIDKSDYKPEEITFKNIWGVCDEDAYRKVVNTLNERYTTDGTKPFFAHIMTISNHRPFTYPDNKVSISPESKSREGGVMYTDYALGQFLAQAQKTNWGKNTVFVILADHCASSAGKTELPIEQYHIPAMIYAPNLIEPKSVDYIVSQIDIMPTLLSMLNMRYETRAYGTNALSANYKPRAFMATYQDLGYLEKDTLTVLSPLKRIRQWKMVPTAENPFAIEPIEKVDSTKGAVATALYQTSSVWN